MKKKNSQFLNGKRSDNLKYHSQVSKLINKVGKVDQESFWNRIVTLGIGNTCFHVSFYYDYLMYSLYYLLLISHFSVSSALVLYLLQFICF